MKNIILASFFLLTITQIYAMTPHVVDRLYPSDISDNLSLPKVPDIQICQECGSRALKKCGNCELTYYCSSGCQKSHWATHKSSCNEIGEKQYTDSEFMRTIWLAYIKHAVDTQQERYFETACVWRARLAVRGMQDIPLYKNSEPSAIASTLNDIGFKLDQEQAKILLSGELSPVKALAWLQKIDSHRDSRKTKAFLWTEQKAAKFPKAPPFDLAKYSDNSLGELVPETEWNTKRSEMRGILRKQDAH